MSVVQFWIFWTYVIIWFSAPASTKTPSTNRGTGEKLCWVHCLPSSKLTLCMCQNAFPSEIQQQRWHGNRRFLLEPGHRGDLGADHDDELVSTDKSLSVCEISYCSFGYISKGCTLKEYLRDSLSVYQSKDAQKHFQSTCRKGKERCHGSWVKSTWSEKNKTRIELFHVQLQNWRGRSRQRKIQKKKEKLDSFHHWGLGSIDSDSLSTLVQK